MSNITEFAVPEVTKAIDYHLNPVFDFAPFWGWPLWIFIFIILTIILLVVHMRWLRKKFILKPVGEYLSAYRGGRREDMQTWIIGKNKSFFIEHLRYHDDGVISYHKFMQFISMWYLHSSLAVGHAGGIKNVIVSDNYDTVRDPVAEIAMCKAIEDYNLKFPKKKMTDDGKAIIDENGEQILLDPIINYDDYDSHRKELEGLWPRGILIDTLTNYDPLKAQKYMPPNRTAGMMGADCIREARKKNIDNKEPSDWIKFAPLGIAMLIGVIAIIFTYVMTGA